MAGVNIMVALKHYKEHVTEAVKAKADLIICGAGLPVDLPGIVRAAIEEFHYKKEEAPALAPIVSSEKAALQPRKCALLYYKGACQCG